MISPIVRWGSTAEGGEGAPAKLAIHVGDRAFRAARGPSVGFAATSPAPLGRIKGLALSALLCLAATGAPPPDALRDPAEEAHAHQLFRQVRCLVCQNESIDDSEAPLAGDLRRLIRAQVAQGRPDAEIRGFLVRRYGEFVLLKPAFSPANAVLWLTPFILVLGGGAVFLAKSRRPRVTWAEAPLDPAEEARLATLTRADSPI